MMGQHSLRTSRRALIGAIAAVPAMALAAFPALASTRKWDTALAAYQRAEADLSAAVRAHSQAQDGYFDERPDYDPYAGSVFRVGDTVETYNARVAQERVDRKTAEIECRRKHRVDETETAMNDACDRSAELFDVLLATPAPNIEAAMTKLELAIAEREGAEHALADIRRLAGKGEL